ncbi:MAG: hypothetical protein N2379_03140 [Verrucomicrobiae bacterium]|nr:hypothetical protein [Verrucomicrobiae bacterium]
MTLRLSLAIVGLGLAPIAVAAPFTPGNLVIYRVGDGVNMLTNRGNPVFLDEYTTNGVLVQSIMLPTNAVDGAHPLIASGTATSEGLLTRSADGRYLVFMGYGTNLGGASILSDSTSTAIPRVIGRVDYLGTVNTTTALTNFASGNNPRSAATDNGTNFWVGGAGTVAAAPGGIAFATLGTNRAVVVSTNPVSNIRQVAIFDGQLYASTASGTAFRIGKVGTGLPTGDSVVVTPLPGIPTNAGSPYAFVLLNLTGGAEPDTLYVADDTFNAIIKFSLVGRWWVTNGAIAASGVRGLTATVSVTGAATNVHLYATTGAGTAAGGGSLYAAVDAAGYNAPPSVTNATVIATAAARTAFRGIALAPIGPTMPPPLEPPHVIGLTITNDDVTLIWAAQPGTTNFVQAASTPDGSVVPAAFADISGPIEIVGAGQVITNWTEPDGATNQPARYYRIRAVR